MTVIRVVDTETTGLDDPAEMVEIGWTDVHITASGQIVIDQDGPRSCLVSPGIAITFGAMATHHITENMVRGGVSPAEARSMVARGADIFCAHNASFDARFVRDHGLPWICTFKAARTLWPNLQSYSNGSIRYERGLCPHDARALPSHRAGPDTWVTAHILADLLAEVSVDRLIEIAENPVLQRTIDFGEHAGKLWSEVPETYLHWMLHKSNMPTDPKREDEVFTARHEVKRRSSPASEVRSEKSVPQPVQPEMPLQINSLDHDSKISRSDDDPRERKGGHKAQRAAIICDQRGFWTFIYEKHDVAIETADAAANWLRGHCGVASRADLDHIDSAGSKFSSIDQRYRLWLDGFD